MKDSQLTSLLTPVVADCGLELEQVEVLPAGKRRLLRVVVDGDGPDGRGPSLDEVAAATTAISAALDDSAAVGSNPYTLEVSTRGISRPLEAERHWRRNRNRLVAVGLTDGSSLTGRIKSADSAGVELQVGNTRRQLAYAEISKAVVQVEFKPYEPDDE